MITRKRLKYEFDNFVAAGTLALVGWLAVLTCILVLLAGVLLVATGASPADQPLSVPEAVWASLMRALDPGTMGADRGWTFRGIMLGVTLGGILLVSTLIGVLSSGISLRYEKLQHGRTWVIERDHVVILGWSEVVFAVVQQLAEAAKTRRKPMRVIILSEEDPLAVREEIAAKVRLPRRIRLLCRKGAPTSLRDLELVSVHAANSVIVVAPEQDGSDDHTLRVALAIRRLRQRRPARRTGKDLQIAVELKWNDNLELIRLAASEDPGDKNVHIVKSDQLMSRVIVQSSRQAGLSHVYSELLSFERNELYARRVPGTAGRAFGDMVAAFEGAIAIGVMRDEEPVLQPPKDLLLAEKDSLILLMDSAEAVLRPSARRQTAPGLGPGSTRRRSQPAEDILILGWNARGPRIIDDLPSYAPPGSTVQVVYDPDGVADDVARKCGRHGEIEVRCQPGDTRSLGALSALGVSTRDHVIVLGYTERLSRSEADTRTLVTLLNLRKINAGTTVRPTVVSEMLDVRNRELADDDGSDDFVVSDHLISLKLAQVAENDCARKVLDQLLSPRGSEVYLRSAADYMRADAPTSFLDVMDAAAQGEEIAIGYRQLAFAHDPGRNYGVHLNPHDRSTPIGLCATDKVIVLARS